MLLSGATGRQRSVWRVFEAGLLHRTYWGKWMSDLHSLAEAIRKGAALRPQAKGQYFAPWRDSFASCALGAAWEGSQDRPFEDLQEVAVEDPILGRIKGRFPVLSMTGVAFPIQPRFIGSGESELWHEITQLNDYYGWTREAIADWLDGLPATEEKAVCIG